MQLENFYGILAWEVSSMEEKKRLSRKEIRRRRRRKKIFRAFLFVFIISFFICLGCGFGIYMGIIKNAEQIKSINVMPNVYTSIIYENKSQKEIDRINGSENREYVTLDKIPKDLQHAFIAIEDERFYEHNGIDLRGLFRAIVSKITKNKTQGASTITQQLIKNTVTKVAKNNLKTKIQEQYLALKFEKELLNQFGSKKSMKDHILEVYLNTIYLYHGLNGVKTAATYYFDKDVSDLNLAECAVIAAITKSPTYYAPDKNPEHNNDRKNAILKKMLELNYITENEYEQAKDYDVYSQISQNKKVNSQSKSFHSYFVDKLIKDLTNDLQQKNNLSKAEAINLIYNGGLKIYSTIDTDMQKVMDEKFADDSFFPKSDYEIDVHYYLTVSDSSGVQKNFERSKTVKNKKQADEFVQSIKNELVGPDDKIVADKTVLIPQPQAAMVIMDYRNGEVKAIIGGRGEKSADLALNRATDSERQPGSVFKILASYAPAIDLKKATAATVIDDAPYTTSDGYSPKNYYKGYRGPCTVRVGIRDSMNILAVKNMMNTGVDNCFDYLLKFGFTTLVDGEKINGKIYSDKVASTALGGLTHGVNQLEVTAAYGTIANLGNYNKPIFYTKVLDHNGNVLLENKNESKKVLSPQAAYILTDMMKDVVSHGTGTKAKFKSCKIPIAGKTGTTTDTKDLTFVGYTPYYVAGIWLGFDQPKQMKEDRGYHLRLWSSIMESIHSPLEVKNFEKPTGIVSACVCKKTGLLATDVCKNSGDAINEIFISGTQPKKYCTTHSGNEAETSPESKATSSPTSDNSTKPISPASSIQNDSDELDEPLMPD